MVNFKGFDHFPLGSASLEIVDGKLQITGLTASGLDGVSIRTNNVEAWNALLEGIEITEGVVCSITHAGTDQLGRYKVTGQQSIYFDENLGNAATAFDSRLLADVVNLKAWNGEEMVYDKDWTVPKDDPETNYWRIALYLALWILSKIDYEIEIWRDGDGNVTQTRELYSWNSSSAAETQDNDGQTFTADRFVLTSEIDYSSNPIDGDNAVDMEDFQIRLKGASQITIIDEGETA